MDILFGPRISIKYLRCESVFNPILETFNLFQNNKEDAFVVVSFFL